MRGVSSARKPAETGPARPVSARILLDRLRHPRPGKSALGHVVALAGPCDGDDQARASAFDPMVRDAFARFDGDFQRLAEAA